MSRRILLALLLTASFTASAANYFCIPSGGLKSGAGTSPTIAWDFEWAISNSTVLSYNAGDVINLMEGTYQGKPSLTAPGGTNQFYWGCGINFSDSPTNWVRVKPYGQGKVVIDCREFRLQYPGVWFSDITWIDSTRSSAVNDNALGLDTAGDAFGLRVDNCIVVGTAGWPETTAYMIGNDTLFVGRGFHDHSVYTQLTREWMTNGSGYQPLYINNVIHTTAGEPFKFVNGGYGAIVASNIIINPGRVATPDGYQFALLQNPGSNYTNAPQQNIYRNYFLARPDEPAGTPNALINLGVGCTNTMGLQFNFNYCMGNDVDMLILGNTVNEAADSQYLTVMSNTFAGPSNNKPFVRVRASALPSTVRWDYNSYISDQPPGNPWFQWGNSTTDITLSAWTNHTVGSAQGKFDINSTLTFSDSTFGGDRWEVIPDPLTLGRGHIVAVNNTALGSKAFDLTPLGLRHGQNYTLLYSMALSAPSTWQTNTFLTNSPNLTITLTTNAWPMEEPNQPAVYAPTVKATNGLPRLGSWLVYPAPTFPTLTTSYTDSNKTNCSVQWNGATLWYRCTLQVCSNNTTWGEIGTYIYPTNSANIVNLRAADTNQVRVILSNAYSNTGTNLAQIASYIASGSNTMRFLRIRR